VLLSVDEYGQPIDAYTGDNQYRPGYDYPSSWTLAGWSADGTKVYVAELGDTSGLGGNYAMRIVAGYALYEVDVASGSRKSVFAGGQLLDIHAVKNSVLFTVSRSINVGKPGEASYNDLFWSKLDGSGKKKLYSSYASQVISAAIYSPSAANIAMVTAVVNSDGSGWNYTLYTLDPANGATKRLGAFTDYSVIKWTDDKTVMVDSKKFNL
jgi:hypothetical protein